MMLPLEGITVVSLEQAIAAPFATRQLADLGAAVIKVERPGTGDFARHYDSAVHGQSSHFVWTNRSKRSLTLDLKHPEAKEIMDRLLARADVFIHNLAPGAVDRLGYDAATVTTRCPKLIVCGISGYGKDGSYRDKKAYDLLIQCETGFVSITGTKDVPAKAGISIADIAAGMYAYSGILTALIQRSRTGRGTVLEVSMLEALGEWMGYPMYYSAYGGEEPERTGANHATIYPYGPFASRDGRQVFLGVQNEREWKAFCENVLREPGLADDGRFRGNANRVRNQERLKPIIDECFRKLSDEEIVDRLDRAHIANARLNSVREFFRHPQLRERNRWRDIPVPGGEIQALLPPATLEGAEPVMQGVPELGQHTDEILREIGFDRTRIESWKARSVV